MLTCNNVLINNFVKHNLISISTRAFCMTMMGEARFYGGLEALDNEITTNMVFIKINNNEISI